MAARVTLAQILAAASGSPNARVTLAQVLVAAAGSPNARVTFAQVLVAAAGSPNARISGLAMEVMGKGTVRVSASAVEVLALAHQRRVSGAGLEVMLRDSLRISGMGLEALGISHQRLVSALGLEIMVRDSLRASGAGLEALGAPFGNLVSGSGLEALGDPFGAKVSWAGAEVMGRLPLEDLILRDPVSGREISLAQSGIPLPRIEYYPAREVAEGPSRPLRVGRPRLVLVWDFVKPEWLAAMFGTDWLEGRTWTVERVILAVNIPVFRVPGREVRKAFWCLVWRPELGREGEWDMGVWRDVRVECPILQNLDEEFRPWIPLP